MRTIYTITGTYISRFELRDAYPASRGRLFTPSSGEAKVHFDTKISLRGNIVPLRPVKKFVLSLYLLFLYPALHS